MIYWLKENTFTTILKILRIGNTAIQDFEATCDKSVCPSLQFTAFLFIDQKINCFSSHRAILAPKRQGTPANRFTKEIDNADAKLLILCAVRLAHTALVHSHSLQLNLKNRCPIYLFVFLEAESASKKFLRYN